MTKTCKCCHEPFEATATHQKYCGRKCQLRARYERHAPQSTTHFLIPDTQVEPGRPMDHLRWIGRYARDRYAGKQLTRVMIGDHWNMGSLSSYDRGKGAMEGRRVKADIDAGNRGFKYLDGPATAEERAEWDDHYCFGNHEDRITRAIESDVQLEGMLSLDMLKTRGWKRHPFREVVELDGVAYAHYFYNPMTGRPYGGENLETRLKTIGRTFTMGHQQGLKVGIRYVGGKQQRALVAGSCYLHDEDYLGPQGNVHWRGIVICNSVADGSYNLMEVDLNYLCRRYEGVDLAHFTPRLIA